MSERGYMLPSRRDDWGTPKKLFEDLNKEFCFDLDAASNDSNYKCEKHFTIKENGLIQSWGGIRYLSIRLMVAVFTIGVKRLIQKEIMQKLLLPFCQPELIHDGFTNFVITKQKYALSKADCILMSAKMPPHFHQ